MRGEVSAAVVAAWLALFNPADSGSWAALRRLLVALISGRRRTSVGLASAYYRLARDEAGVPGELVPRIPDMPVEQVEASLDATDRKSVV